MDPLVKELKKLLAGGGAHVGLKDAAAKIPFELLGERPHDLPYSIWQLVEHIRIAQWDMLEFSRDAQHKSPKWPEGYWPKEAAPSDEAHWNQTLLQYEADLESFVELIQTSDLYKPIPHGTGQTLLREALQIADHTAYHVAEIVVIRRLLGIWE
ncbi:DinB family protein [Pedobacter gandavensis]|uniref:DinB family protein n=1 Tax=Pedobacter gandavensis TaxID=2679963 RepID=UPI00247A951A|nr:DinB family protein [Pedobacter gandavensis]WGQ09201.1 DinB family protein [Pedobacter gandavensis]